MNGTTVNNQKDNYMFYNSNLPIRHFHILWIRSETGSTQPREDNWVFLFEEPTSTPWVTSGIVPISPGPLQCPYLLYFESTI